MKDAATVRVALAYPDAYEVGISNQALCNGASVSTDPILTAVTSNQVCRAKDPYSEITTNISNIGGNAVIQGVALGNKLETDSSAAVRPIASPIKVAIESTRIFRATRTASVGWIEYHLKAFSGVTELNSRSRVSVYSASTTSSGSIVVPMRTPSIAPSSSRVHVAGVAGSHTAWVEAGAITT